MLVSHFSDSRSWRTFGWLAYLDERKSAFELFGDGLRFLQLPGLARDTSKKHDEDDEGSAVSKLDLALATGNNSTLFDNAGGSDRSFTPAELALMLLTFQCFSPGGRIGVATWKGEKTPGNGSSSHAPCAAGNMLHTLIRGKSLAESIHRNMLTKKIVSRFAGENRWGVPVWALFPKSFLTQALLDYATAARLRLRDIYDWHQAAWKAFPGRDGRQRDFLTRLDRLEEQEQFRLLIVSPVEPIRPDWCPADPEAWKTKPIRYW